MTIRSLEAGRTSHGQSDRTGLIKRISEIENEIKRETKKLEGLDEMQKILEYEAGMYFGELSLLNKKPRAGTIRTMTDCFFASIDAEAYERLLKKDNQTQMEENFRFIKQIPYFTDWKIKELQGLVYKLTPREFNTNGHVIAKEGDRAHTVYIIRQGEVEFVK